MTQVVDVRFQRVGKVYTFLSTLSPDLEPGDFVVISGSRGLEMGWVTQARPLTNRDDTGSLKLVRRKATTQDLLLREHFRHEEKDALRQARMLAVEQTLRIKLAKAEYAFDGSRLTLYYGADRQVNLSRLQRELGRRLNTRVELRQIGPRDVAKMLGGAGACGLTVRCCSAFLTDFSPISIKMAKAQDLPLVPAEIAGMCGRLRCCLAYEYEFYRDARKGMPTVGSWITSDAISGRVVDRNIPKQTITVQGEGGVRTEVSVENLWVNKSGRPPAQGGSCGTGGCGSGGCGGACSR